MGDIVAIHIICADFETECLLQPRDHRLGVIVAEGWSGSACEQLIQLRELFGQGFRRTGEGFVEGRSCGVEFV
jgi:hypothetical protein